MEILLILYLLFTYSFAAGIVSEIIINHDDYHYSFVILTFLLAPISVPFALGYNID